MTRLLSLALRIAFAAAALHGAAQARDLDRADPERARILAAAHRTQHVDGRFEVLDLFRDGDAAFFCAVVRDGDGRIERTDEASDLYLLALRQRPDGWEVYEMGGGLGNYPPTAADCAVAGHVLNTRADIAAAIRRWGTPAR
ncbi:hypothetical protein [Burkholderia perseverans]|uniref:hypothetical protein n=1 Tax=Burkholderia perseverans TaxID=2615214 RepID=UPI001FEFC76D|nr:hypothetical protein [Burkholderia perseverans]